MQKRNSILCPNCRKLISADESMCPYCNILRPGSKFKNNAVITGLSDPKKLAMAIIWLNVGMYFLSLVLSGAKIGFTMNPFEALSPSGDSIVLLGATGVVPINQFGRWWTLLSANYLHGSLLHIFFNMMMFWQLVPMVIREYGTHRMITIYTIGGIAGYVFSYLSGTYYSLGASAAVCALVGCLLYFGKSRGGIYGQALYKQLSGWVISLVIFGILIPRIDNWAHGGGIVAGIALGWLLGYEEKIREKMFHKTLGTVCAVSTICVLIWAVTSGIWVMLQ